ADFDFQGRHEHSLPSPIDVPVFRDHESLFRLLLKATRPEPDARFQTAIEMAEQLVGVLRDVTAGSAEVDHVRSALFEDDEAAAGRAAAAPADGVNGRAARTRFALPGLRVDTQDSAASVVLVASAVVDPQPRIAVLDRALATYPDSAELPLRRADALTDLGDF